MKRWVCIGYKTAEQYEFYVNAENKDEAEDAARKMIHCKEPFIKVRKNESILVDVAEAKEYAKPVLKKLVSRASLGSALHTALRKGCDSHPTTIAYNLIGSDEYNDIWNAYLDSAWNQLVSIDRIAQAPAALKLAATALEWPLGGKRNLTMALKVAFDMFSEEDWTGFACYLGQGGE